MALTATTTSPALTHQEVLALPWANSDLLGVIQFLRVSPDGHERRLMIDRYNLDPQGIYLLASPIRAITVTLVQFFEDGIENLRKLGPKEVEAEALNMCRIFLDLFIEVLPNTTMILQASIMAFAKEHAATKQP